MSGDRQVTPARQIQLGTFVALMAVTCRIDESPPVVLLAVWV